MSKRKLGLAILTALLCVCMAMFLVACGTQGEQGEKGEAGKDGISIESVEKVDSEGLVDTYEITYSDGKTTTFTVTNGKDGADGEDGTSITDVDVNDAGELVIYLDGEPVNLGKIVGENGQDGEDGVNGVGIEGATVDENGNLILSLSNDTEINVGKVKGEDGQDGTDGKDGIGITGVKIENGELIITFSDGNSSNLGNIVGADGKDGVGIDRIELDENYNLTIYLTEGEPIKLGCIRGEKGENGADGKSAYELYKEKFGYEGTEEQWLIDLANGNLAVVETHTVTFDAQGGSPEPEAQEIRHGEKLARPDDPTLEGFVFDGWYYQDEKWSFVGYVVTEDMTLTAQWNEADSGCEVTYANGFDIDNSGEIPVLSKTVSNITDNYDMAQDIQVSKNCTWGLYADYNGEQEYVLKSMPLETGENTAYLVVFHSDGLRQTRYLVSIYRQHIRSYTFMNGEEEYSKGTIEENSTLNAPAEAPQKDYYDFSHWEVNGEEVSFPYLVKNDTVFTAVFTPTVYSITYELNGGEAADNPATFTIETETFNLNAPSRAGYTFAGWFNNSEFSGEPITQIALGSHGNMTLWAKWQANENTLHFDGNGATSGSMDDMTIATDASATLTENSFERTGYTFDGWATSAGGEVEYENGAQYTMGTESAYTLYAVWKPIEYTINYELNGGEVTGENPTSFTTDQLPLTLHLENAYKKDYTFMGWYATEEFTGDAVTQITEIGNLTLYARFEYGTEGLIFENNGNGYTLTGYEGKETDVIVPETWLSESVSKILTPFKRQNLTSLVLPYLGNAPENAQYTHLGYVFGGQSATNNSTYVPNTLKSVTVLKGTTLSNEAFYNCGSLTEIILPNELTSIGDRVFSKCSNLLEICIPKNVEKIGIEVFGDCVNLESIEVQAGNPVYKAETNCLIEIETSKLIAGCYNSIIPNYITTIEQYAFYGINTLTKIHIPNSVTYIGYAAFYRCNGLISVTFDENNQLGSIANEAFYQCDALTSISFGKNSQLTSVGYSAFEGCRGLISVKFGENSQLSSIRNSTFRGCRNLTTIEIPKSVTNIEYAAFYEAPIKTVFYGGTSEDDWDTISIVEGTNRSLINANRYYYSEEEPIFDGNYWHYVNGKIMKWEWGDSKTFHFETNGGEPIEDITFPALTELPIPIKEGYYFLGWYDNAEFNGNPVEEPYAPSGDVTLYAKWEKEKTVTFVTNCDQTVENMITVDLQIIELPVLTREGYYLIGWYDNAEFNGSSIEEPYAPSGDITLYAKWEKEKTVTFVTNCDQTVENMITVGLQITELPVLSREGYYLIGWYDNAEFNGSPVKKPYAPSGDVTLYAKWVEMEGYQSAGLEIENGVIVGIGSCTDEVLYLNMPIAERAFVGCDTITKVILGEGVTSIGAQAFGESLTGCQNLKEVVFESAVPPEIGSDVFGTTWNASDFRVYVPAESLEAYEAVDAEYWQQNLVGNGKLQGV